MLHQNGIFLLDYLNAYKIRRNLVAKEEELFRDMTVHIERKIENNMVYKKIRFTGEKLEKPIEYQERVKLYEKDWFERAFAKYGFQIKKCYGSYEGDNFDKEESSRLLMVAKKT
jgi:hypothetical protein